MIWRQRKLIYPVENQGLGPLAKEVLSEMTYEELCLECERLAGELRRYLDDKYAPIRAAAFDEQDVAEVEQAYQAELAIISAPLQRMTQIVPPALQ